MPFFTLHTVECHVCIIVYVTVFLVMRCFTQHYDKIASLVTCSSEFIFKHEIIGTLNIISI